MNNRENVLDLVGLPSEFGHVLLVLSLVLALAPFFSGHDFGILKIPNFTDNAKKILKIIGPISLLVAIGLHIKFFEKMLETNQNLPELPPGSTRSPPKNEPIIVVIGAKVLAPRHEIGCLYTGIILDINKNKALVNFDFGEEAWVDRKSVYLHLAPLASDLKLNAHVYVALKGGIVWVLGQVKENKKEKYLIRLDTNAPCRDDKVYEWAILENIILRY
jgi:hypothetical protein